MRMATGMAAWLVTMALLGGCRAPQPAAPTVPPAPATQPAVDPMTAVNTLIEAPPDFVAQRLASGDYPIPPYAKFLAGVKICLDPGHGGDAHQRGYKRGPTGVREAEFNFRVASYLRELLTSTGAEVLLTREGDVDVSLEDRAAIANEWNADLFISLHHNAIGNKPQVNHTTVWYHADVDYRPSNLDLARYLCDGLYDALALPEITAVPLKSDQLMYPGGFGILRHARVTAALCETSFFTNPEEEQRLRQPEYNLREAYGLFIALAKYAAAGLPRARLVEPADGVLPLDAGRTLVFALDDGLRGRKSWGSERQMILSDSITARIDGQLVPLSFENEGYRLTLEVPDDLTPGSHAVEVQFQNMNKNSVLNPHFTIEVQGQTGTVTTPP
ncbi:MAG TPA: N-acetylmuramoyl-L-alanine amidase [Phycisphaerae bacterium]|nr:N-acetylmuramoyl-L-alanine amidase [Phycisphaerae bacterium]